MLMNEECRFQITSNDYADILIDYTENWEFIERQFGTQCIQLINQRSAIIYLPISRFTRTFLNELNYSAFPSCFGLSDTSSLTASGIDRIQLLPTFGLRGSGTLIGIVDTGIQYTNKIFQNADNTTRIISIWDQTIESDLYPDGLFYGTEYNREEINMALANENPLSIVPSTDEIGHGTMLAGIAGGSRDEVNDFVGVVPDAEFVVVKLKQAKPYLRDFFSIPQDAVCYQENDILQGVKYLYDISRSLGKPIAICIGLGTSQGGHDGRDSLSDYLTIIGDQVGVAVVIAGGNEANTGHHYHGVINTIDKYDTIELRVGENVEGFSMEIWGYTPNTYSIDILSPTGEYIPRIPARLNESRDINFLFEETSIFINYYIVESQTGDQLIFLRFRRPTAGIWRFKVYAIGDLALEFHSWLPIVDFLSVETHFIEPNPDTTITSPGNALIPITAIAYNHNSESIDINSGRGYTRTNNIKPDISAPGVQVYGPLLDGTFDYNTGSSVSAAQTTGVAAMMLEWGMIRGNSPLLDGFEIKGYLIRGARRDPNISYPNKEWGYGILDIYNVFVSLRGGAGET